MSRNAPSNMNAVMTIGPSKGGDDLTFELEQGFSDGYSNTFKTPRDTEFGSHKRGIAWKGGEFKDLSISIKLVAGVQSAVQTTKQLNTVVQKLFSYALPVKLTSFGTPLKLSIGTWFARVGFIKDLAVSWKEPYEIETGMPMVAEVKFVFLTDFLAEEKGIDNKKLPLRDTFSFSFTG